MKRTLIATTVVATMALMACNKAEETPRTTEELPPPPAAPVVNADSIARATFVADSIRAVDSLAKAAEADAVKKTGLKGKAAAKVTSAPPAKDGPMKVNTSKKNRDGSVSDAPAAPVQNNNTDMQVNTNKKKRQ